MTITEPSQYNDKDPSQSAWEKQVTEATNRIQHQIDNINESVNTSESLVAVYSKTQDGAVQQFTPFADGDGFVAYVAYTDSLPTLPVTGATFSAYSDEEIDVIIKQYREVAARPTNPGTTSYQVSGAVWSSSSNWTKTKLNRAGVNVWFCEAKIKGQAGQTVTAKWSNPKLLYGGAVANGILYYNVAATDANKPSAPTATGYDYDSGVFTGLTSGWQYVPITSAMGGGTTIADKHWQVTFHVETSEVTNGQIITFGTVEGVIPIGSDLQSDTYSPNSAGWKIERATGNADFNNVNIRGNSTVQGSVIVDGTVSADAISVGAGGLAAIDANIGAITAGSISAVDIDVTNITITGEIKAENLVEGIVTAVYGGNGTGTLISFTSSNIANINTDVIVFLAVTGAATSARHAGSITVTFSGNNANASISTSNGEGGKVATNAFKFSVAKNTAYTISTSSTTTGENGGLTSSNASATVIEVKRL